MFFLQIAQAPVEVKLGGLSLKVPKFTIDDVVTWASEIHERELNRVTKDMDEVKRREYLTFYQPVAPDIQQMKLHLKTAEGIKRVIRQGLLKADVVTSDGEPRPRLTLDLVNQIIKNNGAGRLSGLAIILADLDEQSAFEPIAEKTGADPLTKSGKPESEGLPGTGATTMPPSTPAIPAETPVS